MHSTEVLFSFRAPALGIRYGDSSSVLSRACFGNIFQIAYMAETQQSVIRFSFGRNTSLALRTTHCSFHVPGLHEHKASLMHRSLKNSNSWQRPKQTEDAAKRYRCWVALAEDVCFCVLKFRLLKFRLLKFRLLICFFVAFRTGVEAPTVNGAQPKTGLEHSVLRFRLREQKLEGFGKALGFRRANDHGALATHPWAARAETTGLLLCCGLLPCCISTVMHVRSQHHT